MVKKNKGKNIQKKHRNKTNFDIPKLRKLIKNELYSNYSSIEKNKPINTIDNGIDFPFMSKEEEDKIYINKYTKYISEEFNSTIVNMIVLYINKSKSFPLQYQKEQNFMFKFVNLLKHLLMNEFEISYFTVVLDKMGWTSKNIEHWTYFCILGIYSKKICGKEEDSSLLINIISRNTPEFTDYYTSWLCDDDTCNKLQENEINIKDINEKYRQLTKPINSYCRKNFINYNGVVDKIVKLSQPYGDASNGNQLKSNEKYHNIDGIIEKNEIKSMPAYSASLYPIQNRQIDINQLKNNLSLKPMESNNSIHQKNMVYNNNNYQSRMNILDYAPNYLPSLNLSLYNNSQMSLNLSNLY